MEDIYNREKIVPWQPKPVSVITATTAISSLLSNGNKLDDNRNLTGDRAYAEIYSSPIAHKITMLAHTLERVLLRWQGAGLMTFDTHCNIGERQYSMTTRGQVQALPAKRFTHIATLTVRPVQSRNLWPSTLASSAPPYMTCARYDEPSKLEWDAQDTIQRDTNDDKYSINSVLTLSCRSVVVNNVMDTAQKRVWLERGAADTRPEFYVLQQIYSHVHKIWDHLRRPCWYDLSNVGQNHPSLNE